MFLNDLKVASIYPPLTKLYLH